MKITTHRIKQYNATYKTVVCVYDKPICIVSGVGKTLSNVIAYLNGYDVPISDGKVKKILDMCKAESEDGEMSALTNITRNCIDDLKMLNEYIEMTYPEVDKLWMMDKVATAMTCVRVVESVLLENSDIESEDK